MNEDLELKIDGSYVFAPIVVFVYNRPRHTKNLLLSLSSCRYANNSDLYIFSDAPKSDKSKEDVVLVRNIIADKKWKDKFKSVVVFESSVNKGLAKSIIDGVSLVIKKYGRVVVIEDDNIVSYDFLDFMNRALDYYYNIDKIGYIGGYTVPIHIPEDYHYDVFTMGRGSSYAWATWNKYWECIDWEVSDYKLFRKNKVLCKKFNEYGPDRVRLLDSQMRGKIDSWAIRFSYSMFKMGKLAILPTKTRVQNIGFDGTGVHNSSLETKWLTSLENDLKPAVFVDVDIDKRIKKEFNNIFRKPSLLKRILRRIKKHH